MPVSEILLKNRGVTKKQDLPVMESIFLSSTILRKRYISSESFFLFFTLFCTISQDLRAGITYYLSVSITDVTISGSSFCAGQALTVSYTVLNSGGKFDNNNVFTAQLSNSSGSFSSPVTIGILVSKQSGIISAIIPPGTAYGTHYRIRVVSRSPGTISNPNGSDITINVLPEAPATVIAIPPSVCAGETSRLKATSNGNSIRWYSSGTGGLLLGASASGADFTVAPAATTIYYAESLSSGGCSSTARTPVTATVYAIPAANAGTGGNQCEMNFRFNAIRSIGTGVWTQTTGSGTSTFAPDSYAPDAMVTVSAYGKYTFTWTETNGACTNMSMIDVNFYQPPVADAGSDQVLENSLETTLAATAAGYGQTGEWTIISGTGEFAEKNDNATRVSNLSPDKNSFKWTLTDGVCPASSDTVNIIIRERPIPTLITPNNDGKNDCFIIRGIESFGKTELVIFNRWGVRVYMNDNYDNKWNGVDNNEDPLPDDTYFFVLRPEKSKPVSGYIILLR